MARVEHLTLPRNGRVIAVSDIHGNLPYFRGLLSKLRISGDDTLILLGDMLEKGGQSLETLRCIMELRDKSDVHPLLGNCDAWYLDPDLHIQDPDGTLRRYLRSQKKDRGPGLLAQMCLEAGYIPGGEPDIPALRSAIEEHFPAELAFLRSLPHIIETKHYTFVHGGLPGNGPLEAMDAGRCMKNDAFLTQGRRFEKWVIVGHWPVMLYGDERCCAEPIIDRDSRIISIDGGCVLKDDGQLNALIIPHDGSDLFHCEHYDPFPVRRVLDAQAGSKRSAYIRWGDNLVRVLERGEEFSRCRHIRTGYEMDILTKYLFGDGEECRCNDCTDYVLPLSEGDEVSVVEECSRGFLVKHKGVSGWYYGRLTNIGLEDRT